MDELRGSPECEHSHDSDSPFIFRLHKIEAGSKDTEDVIVSFEPSSAAAQHQQGGMPTFNRDGKHYTRSFVLPCDGPCDETQKKAHDQESREFFELKAREQSTDRSVLYEPKPSSEFCSICKCPFDDYLKHVLHRVHKEKLDKESYSYLISELIGDFQNQPIECKYKRGANDVRSDLDFGSLRKKRIIQAADSQSATLTPSFCKENPSSTNCTIFQQKNGNRTIRGASP